MENMVIRKGPRFLKKKTSRKERRESQKRPLAQTAKTPNRVTHEIGRVAYGWSRGSSPKIPKCFTCTAASDSAGTSVSRRAALPRKPAFARWGPEKRAAWRSWNAKNEFPSTLWKQALGARPSAGAWILTNAGNGLEGRATRRVTTSRPSGFSRSCTQRWDRIH